MKSLDPIEKTALSFSLCVLAGMGLARCAPAHAENQTIDKPSIIGIINNQNAPQFDGLGYSSIALAKSNVRIGVLYITDANNHVYNRGFCLCACPFVMKGCVEVSKDTPFPVSGTPIPYAPSPLDWRLLVMGSNLLITGDYNV
jgi:hypothetical protein